MKKTALVVGDSIVHGHKKGEKLTADLAEHEWDLLEAGGHIKFEPAKDEIRADTAVEREQK